MDVFFLKTGLIGIAPDIRKSCSPFTTSALGRTSDKNAPPTTGPWGFSLKFPLVSFFRKRHDALPVDDAVSVDRKEETTEESENWVLKILHVRSMWKNEPDEIRNRLEDEFDHQNEQECDACTVDDDPLIEFDKSSFSKLLTRVSLAEARLYSRMSYLGSLAYSIPQIQPGNLLDRYGLRFVTTSLEKKAAKSEEGEDESKKKQEQREEEEEKLISASTAYHIAASAASFVHSQTKGIIPFTNNASLMATTDSVTAVVAAKEEVKQAVADDLNSMHSSPCEWYICDDDQSSTRYFVIQGSESLASWQANLLFEPVQFEQAVDVGVHRGIYEAAKGIYEQMVPEVEAHLQRHGDAARLRFTGHSLGGSLCVLINLMLLVRGQAPRASLLPVITFGAPSVMCGGDALLHKLGLPRTHVQAVTMHRDIVPRAFSCRYPSRVAELLKAVNGNLRTHPCLNRQSVLYAPMGELLILQPDPKLSPGHHLLPAGRGLYGLRWEGEEVRAAQSAFLNTPHPLETLSERSAYGSGGSIQRDHDMESYVAAIDSVIRQELTRDHSRSRSHRRWWSTSVRLASQQMHHLLLLFLLLPATRLHPM